MTALLFGATALSVWERENCTVGAALGAVTTHPPIVILWALASGLIFFT